MATPRATRTYKDLDFDFTAHPVTGDVARKTGDAAIIQSLKGLLQTGAYERLWQPRIHSKLREHLFEPIDNITSSAIEPRVDLIEVNITPEYDSNGYSVTMSFFIVNRTDPITITFFLERIR
jgi:phage baseplate assembly protein W